MNRIALSIVLLPLALCLVATSATADASKIQRRKAEIDQNAEFALDRLFAKDPHAKTLFDLSYGYAVFQNLKVMFGVSGGSGRGVAIVRGTGQRVYMRMGTGGLGLGLGGQKSQVIFLFQDRKTMEDFVYKGWQGDASANAVAGIAGANTNASFTQGIVIYQLTSSGLMLKADVSGTKYWADRKLNRAPSNYTAYSTGIQSEQPYTTGVQRPYSQSAVRSEEIEPER